MAGNDTISFSPTPSNASTGDYGNTNQTQEFPRRESKGIHASYKGPRETVLRPVDHFEFALGQYPTYMYDPDHIQMYRFLKSTGEHFIPDPNWPGQQGLAYTVIDGDENTPGKMIAKFSGSATMVNPFKNEEKQDILDRGLGPVLDEVAESKNETSFAKPPISPFYPFTRMDPTSARYATLAAYNRTHIPVADNEYRKGFRHIFISRPECYICCRDGGLSDQAAHDEDFASVYSRMPHILEILSPSYVVKTSYTSDGLSDSNWNFLLSNRVTGMSTGGLQLTVSDNATKSVSGFTVSTPQLTDGYASGTLELQFNDTKNLEVSEMIRMWMLYMEKRHYGIFSPPYNGYQRVNGFINGGTVGADDLYLSYHPYDRAIEFPCTIFDVITNESDTKILNMCAYLGSFPIQLNRPFNSEANGAITKMNVSVTFKYQSKIENKNTAMVLFNYNSGITDSLGRLKMDNLPEAMAFLKQDHEQHLPGSNYLLSEYIGAASMFTGSPYIVLAQTRRNNPIGANGDTVTYVPYLKFMPITVPELNHQANLGIVNYQDQRTGTIAALGQDTTSYATGIDPSVKMAEELVTEKKNSYRVYAEEMIDEYKKKGSELAQGAKDAWYDLGKAGWDFVDTLKGTWESIKSDVTTTINISEKGGEQVADAVDNMSDRGKMVANALFSITPIGAGINIGSAIAESVESS